MNEAPHRRQPRETTKEQTNMKRITLRIALIALQAAAACWLAGCAVEGPRAPVNKPVFPAPPEEAHFVYERSIYGSADVVKEDKNARLKQVLTGEQGRGGEGLGKPYGVAVYQGRLYVSDTVGHAVAAFDIPKQRYFRIGEEDGGLKRPMGLDVDGKGNLYVVDGAVKQVQVYDPDGRHLRSLGGPSSFSRPNGIAVDTAGSRVYVADTAGVSSMEHRVRVLDARSGAHVLDIGKRCSGPGEFNFPLDVTIGLDGLLYVVDSGNFRIQVFRPDGTFVRQFGSIGNRGGQFARPKEVATDPSGNVYVVDAAFGNFQIFSPEGQLLLAIGSRSETDGMAKYMLPSGIAIDGDGRIYVADQYFRKVDVYRPAKLAEDAGFTVKPEGKK